MKNFRFKKVIASFMAAGLMFASGIGVINKDVRADVNPGITTFVTSLYSDCLGRTPDPTGLNDWCTKLATGQITGKQCAYGFFFSPEFLAKANSMSDTELINAYYKVFLNRGSDPTGASYWAQQIAGTTNDVSVLFTGFADSTEFAQKCASYGVTVGNHVSVPTTVRGSGSTNTPAGGSGNLASQTNGARANSVEELDAYWTSQGFEIFYIDIGYGNSQKCYVRFFDMTDHNNQVNAWRNQNGLPSLAVISDPNDERYQYCRTRAVEVAYAFSHSRPEAITRWNNGDWTAAGKIQPAGEAGENIHGGTTATAFNAFRNSQMHNGAMLDDMSHSFVTACCTVIFVNADGVSTSTNSPSTGTSRATVQLFYY